MSDAVVFCPGPSLEVPTSDRGSPPPGTWCGKYTTVELAERPRGKGKRWRRLPARHPYDTVPRFACDDCVRANAKARVRSLLANGALRDGLDLSSLSPHERQAAAEVLGPEWMATVDRSWDEDRRETPPFGIPMGMVA